MDFLGIKDFDFFNKENNSTIFMHRQNETCFCSHFGDMENNLAPEDDYNYPLLNDFTPIKESEKETT